MRFLLETGGVRADESGATESAMGQSVEGPGVFLGQLVDHGAGFQIGRKHFPGVGFHFEMGGGIGMRAQPVEGFPHVVGRGLEESGGLVVKGNMEMDPPFMLGHGLGAVGFGEGVGEIDPTAQSSVGGAFDDLMKVGVVGERLECLAGLGGGSDAECV